MYLFDIHPWIGTQHCYRDAFYKTCANDHTGCLWNDGQNECMHPAPTNIVCPLRSKYDEKMEQITGA